jgi:hypothetical protein
MTTPFRKVLPAMFPGTTEMLEADICQKANTLNVTTLSSGYSDSVVSLLNGFSLFIRKKFTMQMHDSELMSFCLTFRCLACFVFTNGHRVSMILLTEVLYKRNQANFILNHIGQSSIMLK